MTPLAALLLSIIPHGQEPVRDTCAVLEISHVYDGDGRLSFDQLIAWGDHGECIAWRLIKSPRQLPQRDWKRGGYVVLWDDGGVMREVRARAIDETWTQYDPEVCQRDIWPVCQRRGLSEPRRAK